MPSDKRARQRALRAEKQAAYLQARKRQQNLRRVMWALVLVAAVVVAAVVTADGGRKTAGKTTTSLSAGATSSTVATTTTTVPATSVGIKPVCPPVTGAKTRVVLFDHAPPNCIKPTSVWDATFTTSAGDFTVQMNAASSYAGVNNFVFLALYKYYNGTFFHRVIPGFVVQGGDPTGTGTGGPDHDPGYSFTGNTPPKSCEKSKTAPCYATGDFVYANSTGPTTNGSQFFLVLPGGSTVLDGEPNYTLFGHVISGLSVVEKIGSEGSSSGTPKVKVTVSTVTVKQVKA